MLLFQMTFVFGQENKWGPWNNSDCYPKIQFRAKLVSKQYYNGGSTYQMAAIVGKVINGKFK